MIGFAAQAEIDNVTSDAPLKWLFLAKCGAFSLYPLSL